jgi:hypothetical protein
MTFTKGITALTRRQLHRIAVYLLVLAVTSFVASALAMHELASIIDETGAVDQTPATAGEAFRGAASFPLIIVGVGSVLLAILAWRRAAKLKHEAAPIKPTDY